MCAECHSVHCEHISRLIEKVIIFNLQYNSSKYVNRKRDSVITSV